MSESEDDLVRPMGCEGCEKITPHDVIERGFDKISAKHEVHTVCKDCGLATDRYLDPRDFKHLHKGDY